MSNPESSVKEFFADLNRLLNSAGAPAKIDDFFLVEDSSLRNDKGILEHFGDVTPESDLYLWMRIKRKDAEVSIWSPIHVGEHLELEVSEDPKSECIIFPEYSEIGHEDRQAREILKWGEKFFRRIVRSLESAIKLSYVD